MPFVDEKHFDFIKFVEAQHNLNMRGAREVVPFDYFPFKEGDIVEYIGARVDKSLEDTEVPLVKGRKYVIAKAKYKFENGRFWYPNSPLIYLYIDRPDEIEKASAESLLRKSEASVRASYFNIRPVPTKLDIDLNKLDSDQLIRYVELITEYKKILNARVQQERIERELCQLFGATTPKDVDDVFNIIKKKTEEE